MATLSYVNVDRGSGVSPHVELDDLHELGDAGRPALLQVLAELARVDRLRRDKRLYHSIFAFEGNEAGHLEKMV
jgi:hypothetical protein